MDPIIHLVTNALRLRQDTAAGKVYLEKFEDGQWKVRAQLDALAEGEGWSKFMGITARELGAIPDPEGSTHGDILFRGATIWTRLPAGTSGQVLTTQGPGADPVWATPAAGGAGARTATVIVAAPDSKQSSKDGADFVVPTGAQNAQDVINQAIAALPAVGGTVILMEGTYVVNGTINIPSNVTLKGQGAGTVIFAAPDLGYFGIIQNADTTNGNTNIALEDFRIDGNKANQTVDSQYGIALYKVTDSRIARLWVTNCSDCGIYLDTSSRLIATDSISTGNLVGIDLYDCDGVTVERNACCNNDRRGLHALYGSNNALLANLCRANGREGILIEVSSHNTIALNTCLENSQTADNAYDNIKIAANSDYNHVQANTCRVGALTNGPRYGIRIDSTDCDGNFVTNNDLYNSGKTGALSDQGTGTVTTPGNRGVA